MNGGPGTFIGGFMFSPLITNTPIEKVANNIWVKREDRACISPGPPFAKVRGLWPTLLDLKQQGIQTVGYMDTTVSMAGWGLSYFCSLLDMRAVIFWPQRPVSRPSNNLEQHKKIWTSFGAQLIPISTSKCTRLSMQWYKARSILSEFYPNSFLLPQGLPSQYTITAVSQELQRVPKELLAGTIVVNAGSGVMAAGIICGLAATMQKTNVVAVLASPKKEDVLRKKILNYAGLSEDGLLNRVTAKIYLVDAGFAYEDKIEEIPPFSCNAYYDRKAWVWMKNNQEKITPPILFWNIGAEPEYSKISP